MSPNIAWMSMQYLGHTHTKILFAVSQIQIELSVLYFHLLNLAALFYGCQTPRPEDN